MLLNRDAETRLSIASNIMGGGQRTWSKGTRLHLRSRIGDGDDTQVRKFAAMLAAWPRRSPRLLPAPPSTSTCSPVRFLTPGDLPDEVLLSIFECLTSARDIAAVRGVCCAWRHLVDRTATIWRSLVFDLPRCPSAACHAESWYRKAADYGNAQAQVRLFLSPLKTIDIKMKFHLFSLVLTFTSSNACWFPNPNPNPSKSILMFHAVFARSAVHLWLQRKCQSSLAATVITHPSTSVLVCTLFRLVFVY